VGKLRRGIHDDQNAAVFNDIDDHALYAGDSAYAGNYARAWSFTCPTLACKSSTKPRMEATLARTFFERGGKALSITGIGLASLYARTTP